LLLPPADDFLTDFLVHMNDFAALDFLLPETLFLFFYVIFAGLFLAFFPHILPFYNYLL